MSNNARDLRQPRDQLTVSWPGSDGTPADAEANSNRASSGSSVGLVLGNCRLERLLGKGGMGEVYLAWNAELCLHRAVKVLPASQPIDSRASERFQREVRTLARLSHPNIAGAIDAGEHHGLRYLVLEYVDGQNLHEYVCSHGPLELPRACDYLRQAALGLEYAHRHQIVHRDVKPSNLMRTPDGTIRLLDLGLARIAGEMEAPRESLTEAGTLLGTVDYLAPEQSRDASSADARSDLYSLGCTLFFLLAGQAPFADCQGITAKLTAHLERSPPRLGGTRGLPAAVDELLAKLLAKQPAERFASAHELIAAIDQLVQPAAGKKSWRDLARRHWVLAVNLACLLLFAATWSAFMPWRTGRDTDRARHRGASTDIPQGVSLPRPALQKLTLHYVGDQRQPLPESHALIVNGVEQSGTALPRLGAHSVFKIEGEFSRPVFWYLVWFDTARRVAVEEASSEQTTKLAYPPGDEFQTVSAQDPPGLHLLVVVAGSLAPAQARSELEQRLNTKQTKARLQPGQWARQIRGAGERVSLPIRLPDRFLSELQSQMPPTLYAVQAVFLDTRR